MRKHPDCEDRCQILEHKGYHDCTHTGRCELLESLCAGTKEWETPETDTLEQKLARNKGLHPADWAGAFKDLALSLERRLRAALSERDAVAGRIGFGGEQYPTVWAYEQICKARDEWQRRAEAAEFAREGKPVAWIEHHKGGDNLNWEQIRNNDTPLYRLSAHNERKG